MASLLSQIFGQKPNLSNVTNPTAPGSAYSQMSMIYPNLSSTINTAAGNINDELQGKVPADVQQQIQNAGAAWGINSGMPGSGAAGNVSLEDLGLTSLQQQQQGLGNYLNFGTGLQSQFTLNPEQTAQTDILNSGPNPSMAGLNNIIAEIMGEGGGIFAGLAGKGLSAAI